MRNNNLINIAVYLLMGFVFLSGGCAHFRRGQPENFETYERVVDVTGRGTTRVNDNNGAPDDDYLKSIYPDDPQELRKLVYYKDRIIDSLYSNIDYLYYQIDSLYQVVTFYDGRVTVNQDFEIPRRFDFAGRTFDLSNERVYTMFSEIFTQELRAAHRYIPRSGAYFPLFEEVFASYGIPDDIKYLAIAESGLASMATSPVGAGGIWQFMPGTARQYSLKMDSFVDERRNILKATDAAARYLSNSYRFFSNRGAEDWLLAMCAYNAGDGSVARVMREQQANDFFDLIMRVDETNKYVWRSAAIKLIFDNEEALFGSKFEREQCILQNTRKATLKLNGHHKIDSWAIAQGTVLRRVWELNPWINISQRQRARYSAINDIVLPPGEYEIMLPADTEPNEEAVASAERTFLDRNTGYSTHHLVQRGDTLYGIAKRYGVSVASIQSANNLRGNVIRPGQRLQLIGARSHSAPGATIATTGSGAAAITGDTYTVRAGDNLSTIAQRCGISVTDLRTFNNLSGDVIRPGQELRIRPAGSTLTAGGEYVVKSGDTLSGIASHHKVSLEDLMRLNNLTGSTIRIGQTLKIPGVGGSRENVYIVQRGDSIGGIARKLNVSQSHLISRNNLRVQKRGNQEIVIIQPGQKLTY